LQPPSKPTSKAFQTPTVHTATGRSTRSPSIQRNTALQGSSTGLSPVLACACAGAALPCAPCRCADPAPPGDYTEHCAHRGQAVSPDQRHSSGWTKGIAHPGIPQVGPKALHAQAFLRMDQRHSSGCIEGIPQVRPKGPHTKGIVHRRRRTPMILSTKGVAHLRHSTPNTFLRLDQMYSSGWVHPCSLCLPSSQSEVPGCVHVCSVVVCCSWAAMQARDHTLTHLAPVRYAICLTQLPSTRRCRVLSRPPCCAPCTWPIWRRTSCCLLCLPHALHGGPSSATRARMKGMRAVGVLRLWGRG